MANKPTASFVASLTTGILNKDAAHGLGSRGKKVAAAIPLPARPTLHQSQIRLMDERCGLKSLARLFLVQFLSREPPKFVIDQRQ